MKRVEKEWISYRHLVIPKDASPIQIRECRRAFYAGAKTLLTELLLIISPGPEPTEQDIKNVAAIEEELNEFNELVMKGIA